MEIEVTVNIYLALQALREIYKLSHLCTPTILQFLHGRLYTHRSLSATWNWCILDYLIPMELCYKCSSC
jgi:hypothetical protein